LKTSSQILLAIAVVLSARGAMPGQSGSSPPDHPASTITVTTRLVILDVVVTDKYGAPVENLTRDDFIVTEDKVPQQVRTLELPGEHSLPPGEIVHSTADIAKIGDAPVNILVLGELNTRFEDNAFSRFSLQKFLAAQPGIMPPTTLLVANDKA
jgi:VWFA-related protein